MGGPAALVFVYSFVCMYVVELGWVGWQTFVLMGFSFVWCDDKNEYQ